MTLDPLSWAHIKATAKTIVDLAKESQDHDTLACFYSGIATGLAAAVQIAEGATSDQALETILTRLQATTGQAYLDGKLPAPASPHDGPTVRECADADRNWDVEKAGE